MEGLDEEVVTYCLEESQETGNVICFPDNMVDPVDKMSEDAPPPPSHRFCGLVVNRVYSYVPLANRRELVVGSDYARTDCRSLASLDLANHCVALVSEYMGRHQWRPHETYVHQGTKAKAFRKVIDAIARRSSMMVGL